MFSPTPKIRRSAAIAAALAVAIGTPVAAAGVDQGIGVPPSTSQRAEPYSDALDRYLRNKTSVEAPKPYSDALDRYLHNSALEAYPDALGRFLANELRSGTVANRPVGSYQPQLHIGRGADRSAGGGIWNTAAVVGAAAAAIFIGAAIATRRRRFAMRNV
ncbi:MAG: hypothetical protein H0V45_07660 [Actinobacteria bacterium]|nr:hypothetical protein [Actinomycetota bacterium]